jgi:hypothetical protein
LELLLLDPPHPASSAATAATAIIDDTHVLRRPLVISTFSSPRGLPRRADRILDVRTEIA